MKENVFDVLMYLFENYYMDDDGAVTPDRDIVQQELSQAGFPALQIDRAFQWMEGLSGEENPPSMQAERSMRLFSSHEMEPARHHLPWFYPVPGTDGGADTGQP